MNIFKIGMTAAFGWYTGKVIFNACGGVLADLLAPELVKTTKNIMNDPQIQKHRNLCRCYERTIDPYPFYVSERKVKEK